MKIILIILIILIFVFFNYMRKNNFTQDLYEIAYELGVNYLKLIKKVKNKCVMFDIDDTLLKVNGLLLTPIKPIIKLLNYCKNNGITVLIITARDSEFTTNTINDLKVNGIFYNYLYSRQSPKDDYQLFKSDIKKYYIDKYNLNIVMSIGDNDIDIAGPYSGYSIKLPNKSNPKLYHINTHGQMENVIP